MLCKCQSAGQTGSAGELPAAAAGSHTRAGSRAPRLAPRRRFGAGCTGKRTLVYMVTRPRSTGCTWSSPLQCSHPGQVCHRRTGGQKEPVNTACPALLGWLRALPSSGQPSSSAWFRAKVSFNKKQWHSASAREYSLLPLSSGVIKGAAAESGYFFSNPCHEIGTDKTVVTRDTIPGATGAGGSACQGGHWHGCAGTSKSLQDWACVCQADGGG